eukprot:1558207-Lingulodinium_polyedra.AAC.1
MELDDNCAEEDWLQSEPTTADLRGLWSHNLWTSKDSIETANIVKKIEKTKTGAPSGNTTTSRTIARNSAPPTTGRTNN